jgi:hypothetical protein
MYLSGYAAFTMFLRLHSTYKMFFERKKNLKVEDGV